MPLEAQTRLLRVLQQGEFMPVGGQQPGPHQSSGSSPRATAICGCWSRQGLFREDLFYRLNVVPIRLPPLRERVDDIPALVQHFLARAQADGLPLKTLTPEAMVRLKRTCLARATSASSRTWSVAWRCSTPRRRSART